MSLRDLLIARYGESPDVPPEAEKLARMAARGSCRKYLRDPVPMDLIRTLCGVALASPSKSDLQQRDIVIVTDPAIRARLDAITGWEWQREAPAFLVFCANHARMRTCHEIAGVPSGNHHLDSFFNASVDAGIALATFITAAEAVGLGCCPISVIRNQPEEVADALALPDFVVPVAGLTLGWPAEPPALSPRLSLRATVHENKFPTDQRAEIEDYDRRRPPPYQRAPERWGEKSGYGWSDDKARQYADPQRTDWGAFVRGKGFSTE